MTDAVFQPENLREDIDVEAKQALGRHGKGELPDDVWETYSAFANTEGGTILLGVAERQDGTLEALGMEEPGRVIQQFWDLVNNPRKVSRNLLSSRDVATHRTASGRWIVQIEVPRASRRERPVFLKGNPLTGTFKRGLTGDFRCSEEDVRRMLAEQTEDARDARILPAYGFDDLDMDSFRAYRNRLAALKPDHPFNGSENRDFLRKLGGWGRNRETGEEGLTLAGLLMFGTQESIQEAVPHYFLDYRELPKAGTKTEWIDRLTPDGTWSGNLYDFYRLTIQRLFQGLKVPFRLEGDAREDDTPVHKALREALVNTILHADYSARISILVVKAPDYFGFRNPGQMRIPIDKALEGGHSDCRNRSLQKMFSLIGLGEQAGSGIPRVLENWQSQHYRVPELWETQDPEATLMRMRTVSLLPEETLEDLRTRFGNAFEQLGENERLAMAAAGIEGFVTNGRMQQLCRMHPRDLTALLKGLEDQGFLVHDGKGRGTTYRLADSTAVDLAHSPESSDGKAGSVSFEGRPLTFENTTIQWTGSSSHLDASSSHLSGSSSHLGPSSSHSTDEAPQPVPENPRGDPELLRIADPVRNSGKADGETTRATIMELCRGRFLSVADLASLLNRSPAGVRNRFVKPMTDQGELERRFPNQPNHEQQAYRTREP